MDTGTTSAVAPHNSLTLGNTTIILPAEIITMIRREMYTLDGGNEPTLARLVFASDPKIRAEFPVESRKSSILVNNDNIAAFRAIPLKDLMRYEHIKVVENNDSGRHRGLLIGSRASMMNNFLTINYDLTHLTRRGHCNPPSGIQWLINASKRPQVLFVKMVGQQARESSPDDCLGMVGRLERVSPQWCDELWFWKKEDGTNLEKFNAFKSDSRSIFGT